MLAQFHNVEKMKFVLKKFIYPKDATRNFVTFSVEFVETRLDEESKQEIDFFSRDINHFDQLASQVGAEVKTFDKEE